MREIKFRAYDKDAKPWNEKYSVRVGGEHRELTEMYSWEHLQEYGIDIFIEPGSWEIMQYTGLKDINKTEIYEGDILQCNGVKYRLEWDASKACELHEISNRNKIYFLFQSHYLVEVIGNIYQNPELLK